MKISYAIPVCNELSEIQHLVTHLLHHKRNQDEIVILYDSNNGHEYVEEYLRSHSQMGEYLWFERKFDNDFAAHKNALNKMCDGDWIFQIDADEYPDEHLIEVLPDILEHNNNVDLFFVPRVNIVKGLTDTHLKMWGWQQNDKGWVNWPDFQSRIYRNHPDINWTNHVHERIVGHKEFTTLPTQAEYALWHIKDVDRQERQNEYYDTLV